MIITFLGLGAWCYVYICFVLTLFFPDTRKRFIVFCFLVLNTLIILQLMPYLGEMTGRFVEDKKWAQAWEAFFLWVGSYKVFSVYCEAKTAPGLMIGFGYTPLSLTVQTAILWVLIYFVNIVLFTNPYFMLILRESGTCYSGYMCSFLIPIVVVANLVGVFIPYRIICTVLDKVVFYNERRESPGDRFEDTQSVLRGMLSGVSFFMACILIGNMFNDVRPYNDSSLLFNRGDFSEFYGMMIGVWLLPVGLAIAVRKFKVEESIFHFNEKKSQSMSLSEYSAKHMGAVFREDNFSRPIQRGSDFSSSPVARQTAHTCHCDVNKMAHTSVRMPFMKKDNMLLSVLITCLHVSTVFFGIYFIFIHTIDISSFKYVIEQSQIISFIHDLATLLGAPAM